MTIFRKLLYESIGFAFRESRRDSQKFAARIYGAKSGVRKRKRPAIGYLKEAEPHSKPATSRVQRRGAVTSRWIVMRKPGKVSC